MGGLVGQTLGRYEIVALVGKGGMGEVFRARDTELGRDVAIKVLLEETARDKGRLERFKREARAVAQLSHPNILDIHDFGTENGVSYSVTELLEGSDLRQRLEGHPLPVSKVLKIGRVVAEGLAAAHSKGIVHRDIKPANIFVTKTGQVKILDFGIAGLRSDFNSDSVDTEIPTRTLTETGQIIGTTAYMSPEQVAGKPADARSDIFSLGCVLYEMLTGRKAFDGATLNETMVATVSKDPTPISELRPDAPTALDLLIQRCLEKEPDERFESARDVAFALGAMSLDRTVPSSETRKISKGLSAMTVKIAIGFVVFGIAMILGARVTDYWPFASPSLPLERHLGIVPLQAADGNAETSRFAAGMSEILAEDLEWLLQRAPNGWWVVPSASARRFETTDIQSMYRRFDSNVVLSGAIQRRGPSLRIDLTSVDPESGGVLRKVGVEGDLGNVSSLQIDPIVRAAEVVGVDFTAEDREFFVARATNVARTFELYVLARGVLAIASEDDEVSEAINFLEEAVELDPLFSPARELLAEALWDRFDESHDQRFFDRALEELTGLTDNEPTERALRIMANLFLSNGNAEESVSALERAVQVAPRSGEAYLRLGSAYSVLGRNADAERAYQRSINLRPGYYLGPDSLGRLYLGEGSYDAAANWFRQVIDCAPRNKIGYNVLGVVHFIQNDLDASLAVFQRSIAVDPQDNYFAYSNLGTLHFEAARFADAIVVYEEALAISDDDYQVWGNLAYAYAFGAEPERSRAPFDRAIELAEERRTDEGDDIETLADLAGFYAMVDQPEKSGSLLESIVALEPRDPQIYARIGETYEDLNDRETALEWIGRAIEGGIQPRVFDARPMLRGLVADPRYRDLIESRAASPNEK